MQRDKIQIFYFLYVLCTKYVLYILHFLRPLRISFFAWFIINSYLVQCLVHIVFV
jgi:hypothetical protein